MENIFVKWCRPVRSDRWSLSACDTGTADEDEIIGTLLITREVQCHLTTAVTVS